ncbi:hypothetical protein VOLCADRAFT_105008 [Volvox carteri f. nagariensis]|uniref:Uncharacterized protein n=1 Tax=Volvox carteri f. nagariensis TaxID=3068 RepID=D8TXS5_VOLCA|nr:uncharacterized protein VOLCADRAFT_105008 [Volvox carteri f. nagariensis]EFJ47692.1 hypothetical protein VOLCADRAFT_105008 [Volvox carteri f. nagariensis]|eukprot:XP_002951163.1 hypothetical protein VOLCADRAFT_105008 [Volvox carteri f. nagariensis]
MQANSAARHLAARVATATATVTVTVTVAVLSTVMAMGQEASLVVNGMMALAMSGGDGAVGNNGGGASAVSVSWDPFLISPRPRMHISGVSNLSYKPPSSVTAEPAAAVLQRRRAAFTASRCCGSPVSAAATGSSASIGAFLFGSGGGGGVPLRSPWGSPTEPSSHGPLVQLLTIGLGTAIDGDGAAKGLDGSGGGNGGGKGAAPIAGGGGGGGRTSVLAKSDSDLGQNCSGVGGGEDGDGGGGDAAAAAAMPAVSAVNKAPGADTPPRVAVRPSMLPSAPSTPLAGTSSLFKPMASTGTPSVNAGAAAAAAAAATAASGDGGGGGDAGLTEAQTRSRRRTSARSALPSLDGEPATSQGGPYLMGDTSKMLQVGISVAALMEVVKALPATARFATTAEVFDSWLMPPTRGSQFLDLVMARVKIVLGEPPEASPAPSTPGARASYNGLPVLHPDRTWFGPPDHYVIHSWSGNFMSLVSALREYCGVINKTPSSTYVWLDVVAANHHPGRKDKKELPHCNFPYPLPYSNLPYCSPPRIISPSRQIMATARKALLVLDPMANSLTRLWCLYEIWLAVCALPGASPAKLTMLNAGTDWDAFADSFFRLYGRVIDLSRCAASLPEDRAKLLEDMIRTSHDAAGSGNGSQHASGTTISPYGVVAALPQLSAAVRGALFDASAGDVAEARKGARAGGIGVLALLDAVERYAMIRRLAGGHVEAEEQLEAAVAVAMGVSGAGPRNTGSIRPSSPPKRTVSGSGATAAANASAAAANSNAEVTVSGAVGIGAGGVGSTAATKIEPAAAPAPAWADSGGADGGAEPRPPPPPLVTLPPIFPSYHTSSTVTATGGGTAATAAAAGGSSAYHNSSTAEHGRLIQASTHAAMALSCIPGLTLVRPPVNAQDKSTDGDGDPYDHSGRDGSRHDYLSNHGGLGGGGGGGSHNYHHSFHHSHSTVGGGAAGGGGGGGGGRQRSVSPPGVHTFPSMRTRHGAYDNGGGGGGGGGNGGDHDRKSGGGQVRGGGGGGGGGTSNGGVGGGGMASSSPSSSPPPAPGEIAWKGSYWELTSPQNIPADGARAIFMASLVEATCGRHEAAAQLALQAGLARAATLGPGHPSTLATKRAAVPQLLQLGRLTEAQILAKSLLRLAVSEHGDLHPSVGLCHGAVAMVLAAQNKAELAYSSAQRGAEVLAACLGRGHPATLEALQLCADMLESAREYGKAVALMRLVVQGRSVPGAIRTSPASPAFLAPNNRLLHLRTIAALEEKAMSEEHSRRAMIGVMRSLSRLETELRAALMAMTGAAAQTQMQIQRDLELVLMAQNKRYEAAMLRKGELRPA